MNDKYLHGNQYFAYIGGSHFAKSYRLFAEKNASYFATTERTSHLELEKRTQRPMENVSTVPPFEDSSGPPLSVSATMAGGVLACILSALGIF